MDDERLGPGLLNPRRAQEQLRDECDYASYREHFEACNVIVQTSLAASPTLEKAGTWLLAAAGGAIALSVPNLKDMQQVLGVGATQWALLFLACSIVSGLLAKFMAVLVQHQLQIAQLGPALLALQERWNERFEPLERACRELDVAPPSRIRSASLMPFVLSSVPKLMRWHVKLDGPSDRLEPLRDTMRHFAWIMPLLYVQFLTFLAFTMTVTAMLI